MWIKQRTSVYYIILIVVVYAYHSLNRGLTVKGILCPVCYDYIPLWCNIFATKVSSSVIGACFLWTLTYYSFILLSFQFHCHVWKMNWHPQVSDRWCNACWIYFLNLCPFLYVLTLDWNAVDLYVQDVLVEFWLGPSLTGFSWLFLLAPGKFQSNILIRVQLLFSTSFSVHYLPVMSFDTA
jgi:hypothetical protein